MVTTAPAPTSPPPSAPIRRAFSQWVGVQLSAAASTLKPTMIAALPSSVAASGAWMLGGAGGGAGGREAAGGGVGSSRWALSASARRNITSRASATVQTSQLFDLLATGSAAGAGPSVEKIRPTTL